MSADFEELLADWVSLTRQRKVIRTHIHRTRVLAISINDEDIAEMLREQATGLEDNELDQVIKKIEELENAMRDIDAEPETMHDDEAKMLRALS